MAACIGKATAPCRRRQHTIGRTRPGKVPLRCSGYPRMRRTTLSTEVPHGPIRRRGIPVGKDVN